MGGDSGQPPRTKDQTRVSKSIVTVNGCIVRGVPVLPYETSTLGYSEREYRRIYIVCGLRRCDVRYVSEHCVEAFEHNIPISCRTVDEIASRERAQHACRLRDLECIES